MAGYFIYSFTWEALQALLAPPATELAEHVAKKVPKKRGGALTLLPKEPAKLVQVLADHYAEEDWYIGKSVGEAQLAERLLDAIFQDQKLRKYLALTPPPDSCYFDVVEVASGISEVDLNRSTKHDTYLQQVNGKAKKSTIEMRSLGQRPYRHPAWDHDAYVSAHYDDDIFRPAHSMHSPAQTRVLLEEAEAARPRIEISPCPAFTQHFEEYLVAPLCAAVERGHGLYVVSDT